MSALIPGSKWFSKSGDQYTVIGVTNSALKAEGIEPGEIVLANERASPDRRAQYPLTAIIVGGNGMLHAYTYDDMVAYNTSLGTLNRFVVYRGPDGLTWARHPDSFLESMTPQ
tara:strand:- start:108163 stop:108501 length:339 start_codon:yes stop_codon:yes gene_type:complete